MKWPRPANLRQAPLDTPPRLPRSLEGTDRFPAPPTTPAPADAPLPATPWTPRGSHPGRLPRRFLLRRDEDISGVSGTGVVAEGIEFTDGVVSLRWIVPEGNTGHGYPTSVVFHDNGRESVEKIHGHSGSTKIVWLDE